MRSIGALLGWTLVVGCGAARYPVVLMAEDMPAQLDEGTSAEALMSWAGTRAEREQAVPPDTLVFCQPVSFGYQAKLRWGGRELPLSAIVASVVSWDVHGMTTATSLEWSGGELAVRREGQSGVAVLEASDQLRNAPVADVADALSAACERYSRVLLAMR